MRTNLTEHRYLPYLLIAVTGGILYCQTLTFGYTFFDDNGLILERLKFLRDPANLPAIFRQDVFNKANPFVAYHRPLLTLSFMADAMAGGVSPFMYHLTNIILHLTSSCLVFYFFTMLKYGRMPSLVLSLIFVVHPALVQAVAWIPGRNDSLLAIGVLLSFISLMRFIENGRWQPYILHIVFFFASLLTKESAVFLPFLYILYYFLINGKKADNLKKGIIIAGWAGALAVWFALRKAALDKSPDANPFDIAGSVYHNLEAVVQSIGKAFLPFNLSVLPIKEDTSSLFGICAIIIVALALILSKRKRPPFILFGLSWGFLFLIFSFARPLPAIISPGREFLEHRLYVPMIGFFIVALETDYLKSLNFSMRQALIAAISVILIFSVLSFQHARNFRDRKSFWANAVRTSPHAWLAHMNMGIAYYTEGDLETAEREYRIALRLNQLQPMGHTKLGMLYMDKKMFREAEKEFKKELAVNPLYDGGWLTLGTLYYKLGRQKDAEYMWSQALEVNPLSAEAHKNLAIYYRERGDLKKAASHVKALRKLGDEVPEEFARSVGMD